MNISKSVAALFCLGISMQTQAQTAPPMKMTTEDPGVN